MAKRFGNNDPFRLEWMGEILWLLFILFFFHCLHSILLSVKSSSLILSLSFLPQISHFFYHFYSFSLTALQIIFCRTFSIFLIEYFSLSPLFSFYTHFNTKTDIFLTLHSSLHLTFKFFFFYSYFTTILYFCIFLSFFSDHFFLFS